MTVDYAKEISGGSVRAVARLITLLEDGDPRGLDAMARLYPHTGTAYVIGITGAPGAGKSTLTDRLTSAIRSLGLTVGIVAVDPSSPFTGGAVLGDRVRMMGFATDPGVYIRSMATRGFLGGLARATSDTVKVLDASGKDVIIVETVGVGQDEVDIIGLADTTCVVLVPGLGDTIQSMKAGIMEIADIFVVNKADNAGADQLCAEVNLRLETDSHIKQRDWTPPLLRTVAVHDEGIKPLWEAIERHREHLRASGRLDAKRRDRTRDELLRLVHDRLFRRVREQLETGGALDGMLDAIADGRRNPYAIATEIMEQITISHIGGGAS